MRESIVSGMKEENLINKLAPKEAPKLNIIILTKKLEIMNTLTVMETYLLGQEGKKVLLIDFDPQGNATEIMKETYKADLKQELSLYEGLLEGNLSKSIVSVTNQIDMIPTDWTLSL